MYTFFRVITASERYWVHARLDQKRICFIVDFTGCGCCCSLVVMASLDLSTPPSLIGLVAVHAVGLHRLVRKPNKTHCCFCRAAVLAGPGDGVADTSISQPASITAIVALNLPGGKYVAHLGDLRTIFSASLHSLSEGQPFRLHQPIQMSWQTRKIQIAAALYVLHWSL